MITPYCHDSPLVKVTTWAPTAPESIRRMDRALREFRIRGVASNLQFLENVINHPAFRSGDVTTRFIDKTPELMAFTTRQDRATKLLRYLGDVCVNGHPEINGRTLPPRPLPGPVPPQVDTAGALPTGTRDLLRELGAEKFARWMLEQKRVLLTGTRPCAMRTSRCSPRACARPTCCRSRRSTPANCPNCSSRWSAGAGRRSTWRCASPEGRPRGNVLSNCAASACPTFCSRCCCAARMRSGYTNYADNVVRFFVRQAASAGVDVFRVFDSLNWVRNMRVAIDAVGEAAHCAKARSATPRDIFDGSRSKYDLKYYVGIARELQAAGVHVLGIKDMAGICASAGCRRAGEGAQGRDGPPRAFPHPRYQRHFGCFRTGRHRCRLRCGRWCARCDERPDIATELVEHRGGTGRQRARPRTRPGRVCMRRRCTWEGVRRYYAPFESEIRAGTAGCLRATRCPVASTRTCVSEPARSASSIAGPEVSRAYADVNQMFGDIVKVTPDIQRWWLATWH
ncbi:hypothetical protein ACTMU2_14770 [Cupriavidus basilensis]